MVAEPTASGYLLLAQQLHGGFPHSFKILSLGLHEVIVRKSYIGGLFLQGLRPEIISGAAEERKDVP